MTAEEIKALIDESEAEAFGLRADVAGYKIGDVLCNSHQWWQDDPEDPDMEYNEELKCWDGGELDGVSTIGIEKKWLDPQTYVATIDDINLALKAIKMYAYEQNRTIYLIAGDNTGCGNDIGEQLIGHGTVIGIIG